MGTPNLASIKDFLHHNDDNILLGLDKNPILEEETSFSNMVLLQQVGCYMQESGVLHNEIRKKGTLSNSMHASVKNNFRSFWADLMGFEGI